MKNNDSLAALRAMQTGAPVPGEVNTESPMADSIHNLSVREPGKPSWMAVLEGILRLPGYTNPVPVPPKPMFEGTWMGKKPEAVAVGEEVDQ